MFGSWTDLGKEHSGESETAVTPIDVGNTTMGIPVPGSSDWLTADIGWGAQFPYNFLYVCKA